MAARRPLQAGTRVLLRSGALGTIERVLHGHSGYDVTLDEPVRVGRVAEIHVVRVLGSGLTPTDPSLHAAYEESWPSFDRRSRSWAAAARTATTEEADHVRDR